MFHIKVTGVVHKIISESIIDLILYVPQLAHSAAFNRILCSHETVWCIYIQIPMAVDVIVSFSFDESLSSCFVSIYCMIQYLRSYSHTAHILCQKWCTLHAM